jgi:hypothetical protein
MTDFPWTWSVASPAIKLRTLVSLGVLPAIVVALVVATQLFDVKRECRGAFSLGFGPGFDVYRCNLTIKAVGTDLSIPLPRLFWK